MLKRPAIIFVLGPPGSGKGTQCELISHRFNMHHISAGDLLRNEVVKNSSNGQIISKSIKEGLIVPIKITLQLLKDKMMELGWNRWFLIDGFPRNLDNLDGWNDGMSGVVDVERILYIKASQETCVSRILQRAEMSNRTDDNVESIKKRFVTYHDSTYPIIEHYMKLGLVTTISGEDEPEKVYDNIRHEFQVVLNLTTSSTN